MTTHEIELLRQAIRAYLVNRRPAAFAAEAIASGLRGRNLVDFPVTKEEVERELALLVDLKHVDSHTSDLGSTRFYFATSTGVLATERAAHG